MIIQDGKGRGFSASVGGDNKLDVCAVTRTVDLFCNQGDETSYSLLINQTPAGANDCFCHIKNNDDMDMVVSSVKLYTVSTEIIALKLNDSGSPVGGSDASLVNRNAGSGNVAEVTVKVGNDITGLSGGDEVEALPIKGGETAPRYEWLSGLIIPKNHVLTFWAETGGIAVRATLSVHFCLCE